MFHQIFAINEATGRTVHAEEESVQSGLACGCVCSLCFGRLVARKGEVRRPHFAHLGAGAAGGRKQSGERPACPYSHKNSETDLHKFAKRILTETQRIWVPEWSGDWKGEQDFRSIAKSVPIDPDTIQVEQTVKINGGGSLKPDIQLLSRGHPLIVEIAVTHHSSSRKRDQLARAGIPAIEITLDAGLLREASYEEIKEAVLHVAERRWLYHPAVVERMARIRKDSPIDKAQQAIRNEQYEVALRKAEELTEQYDESDDDTGYFREHLERIGELGLEDLVGVTSRGYAVMGCKPEYWQSVALLNLLEFRDQKFVVSATDLQARILDRIRAHHDLPKQLDRAIRWDELKKIHEDIPEFWTTWHAVGNYLRWLSSNNEITTLYDQNRDIELNERLREAAGKVERNEGVLEDIENLVEAVLKHATPADLEKYHWGNWLDSIDPRFMKGELADIPGELIAGMISKLRAIKRFVEYGYAYGDGKDLDLMGLPFTNTLAGRRRAAAKERKRRDSKRTYYENKTRQAAASRLTKEQAQKAYKQDKALLEERLKKACELAANNPALGPKWLKKPHPNLWNRAPEFCLTNPFTYGRRLLQVIAAIMPDIEDVKDPWAGQPISTFEPDADNYLLSIKRETIRTMHLAGF